MEVGVVVKCVKCGKKARVYEDSRHARETGEVICVPCHDATGCGCRWEIELALAC